MKWIKITRLSAIFCSALISVLFTCGGGSAFANSTDLVPANVPTNISTTFKPHTIAYGGDDTMFVSGQGPTGARLIKLSLSNNTVLFDTELPAGSNPLGIAACGATVWTANFSTNSLSVVNAKTGTLLETIAIPESVGSHPEGIVCAGESVWVAFNSSYTIAQYDVATRARMRTETVGKFPAGLAYNNGYLFVTVGGDVEGDGRLKKIKVSNEGFDVVWSAPTGTYPWAVVIPLDGSAWVGSYYGCDVTRINEETGEVLGTYPLNGSPRGGVSDGKHVSFAVTATETLGTKHTLTMFNLDGTKVGEFEVGSHPRDVAFNGMNHFVANSGSFFITKL